MIRKNLVRTSVAVIALWLLAWTVAGALRPQPAPERETLVPDQSRVSGIAIAPRSEALTFARYEQDGKTRLMLVGGYAGGSVSGIEIRNSASDPISLFNALGYDALENLEGREIAVPAEQLLLPFDGTGAQVAIGINYPEHGKEVALVDSFVFPKMTAASRQPFDLDVKPGELLDYELELGFVALQPIARDSAPRYMGLVLASDFTDRAALMRRINLRNLKSGEGFTEAKSRAGFMPIGNLLVIPRHLDSFYKSLSLQLWLNSEQRQLAEPAKMSWDVRRMIAETFGRQDRRWQYQGHPVALPVENGAIPARTIFLSGTPDGVIFQPPTTRQMFVGLSEMIFTLKWNKLNAIVEPFIREELASGRYLRAGDEVVMRADRLGVLVTRIRDGQD